MNVLVDQLTGQDLVYWVARANLIDSVQEVNVLRSHYGQAATHDPINEPYMREFVRSKFGGYLPPRNLWQ